MRNSVYFQVDHARVSSVQLYMRARAHTHTQIYNINVYRYDILDDDDEEVGTVRIRHAAAHPKIGHRVRRNYRALRPTYENKKKKSVTNYFTFFRQLLLCAYTERKSERHGTAAAEGIVKIRTYIPI